MNKAIKQLGLQAATIVMAIVLIVIEYLIAGAFGLTVNGMPYFEYEMLWISTHPIETALGCLLVGWILGNIDFS